LVGSFFLGFVAFLAFSRYGKLQVGKEGDRPEFSRFAWFAMRSRPG
jgi:choline-glycine betaine transporter